MNIKRYLPLIALIFFLMMIVATSFDFYLDLHHFKSIIYLKSLFSLSLSDKEGNYVSRVALSALAVTFLLPYLFIKEKNYISKGLKILCFMIMLVSPIVFIICLNNIFNFIYHF